MTDDLVGRHRAALIEAGREAGAFLADDVSDDFLLYVPGEVKGRIAKLTARIEALEGENHSLKQSVVAFCAPWAVQCAKQCGIPDGHLHATHYGILTAAGARMDAFTRHDEAPHAD